MNWIELSDNKTQWKSIFGDFTPPSEMSVIHAIFEGNSIKLKIAAPMIGEAYPKKWLNQYNHFDFDLYLIGTSQVEIKNFSFTGNASIFAERTDATYVTIEIGTCNIKCKTKAMAILNITGFHNDKSL